MNASQTSAWQLLQQHYNDIKNKHLNNLFAEHTNRGVDFSIETKNFLFDYSKHNITHKTIALFIQLAQEMKLKENINAMFSGKTINETENRAVLHTALRKPLLQSLTLNDKNIMQDVGNVLHQMKDACNAIHQHQHKGYTNKPIKNIVNIGIGGSHLGPNMVCEALKPFWQKNIQAYFISNIDGAQINDLLQTINPEETLFLIASKTFTTQETMTNALTAKKWFLSFAKDEQHVSKHFFAISTNIAECKKFGIDEKNIFAFWDWVGGRYSLWSSIGLSIALTIGFDNFEKLLQGANDIDEHFQHAPFEKNIPFLMAILGIWYRNFYHYDTLAILPYYQHLQLFPAFLQQLDMESNGKYIDKSKQKLTYNTAPILWGDVGTNGQHSFYQLLHQGTSIIPVDFIAVAKPHHPYKDHNEKLIANCFAQAYALMKGRPKEEIVPQTNVAEYQVFEGNRPSSMFLFKTLTPYSLGQLIACYEHKVFVQGVLWDIYSFDQFGVELGKQICNRILPDLLNTAQTQHYDSSTNQLIEFYKKHQC